MKSLFIFLALNIIYFHAAEAYFLAAPSTQGSIDFQKPTRILVSGRGTDLGLQPQLSALGRAKLYRRNFPEDQVVLLSVFENKGNPASLRAAGWTVHLSREERFKTHTALPELLKFSRIRSIDFFGHNSPSLGTQLDGLGYRFEFHLPEMDQLTTHFDKGAFVIIHGCNSGWITAPHLAKLWNIPVAGAFTGTQFEHLHTDQHFYVYANRQAPSSEWAKQNTEFENAPCTGGSCIRMRPTPTAYVGKWGHFSGPLLNYYKFFCPLEIKECEKRMALSLYGFVGEKSLKPESNLNEFRNLAKQYFCPLQSDRKLTESCLRDLERIDRGEGDTKVNFTVNGKQLRCDFNSCNAKMACNEHKCSIQFYDNQEATTTVDEYQHFVNGFHWLQEEGD